MSTKNCAVSSSRKLTGVAGLILRAALAPVSGDIVAAFIYGSIASGQERPNSDIDLMIIGYRSNSIRQSPSRSIRIKRNCGGKINPAMPYTAAEFKRGVCRPARSRRK